MSVRLFLPVQGIRYSTDSFNRVILEQMQASKSKYIIYHSSQRAINEGSIISNEPDRFKLKLYNTNADCLFGIGTSTMWDIAWRRKVKRIIFLDISEDVINAHLYFYRPLFLISESPSSFILNFFGIFNKNEKTSIKEAWKIVLNKSSSPQTEDLLKYFYSQVQENIISENEYSFLRKIIQTKVISSKSPSPFKKIHLDLDFREQFKALHEKKTLAEVLSFPSIFLRMKSISFLGSSKNYDFVRNLYLSEKVHYCLADLEDKKMFQSVNNFLEKESATVSDIYLSNTLPVIEKFRSSNTEKAKEPLGELLRSSNGSYLYEILNLNFPFQYKTTKF